MAWSKNRYVGVFPAVFLAFGVVGASVAEAAPLSFFGEASGTWINPVAQEGVRGEGNNVLEWGTGANNLQTVSSPVINRRTGQAVVRRDGTAVVRSRTTRTISPSNSWSFVGSAFSDIGVGDRFSVGTFTYQNGTVRDGSHNFESADLGLTLAFSGPFRSAVDFSFGFGVETTPDRCDTAADPTCSDDTTFIARAISDQIFQYDGVNYSLKLLGFEDAQGPASVFQVPELQQRSASLFGEIVRVGGGSDPGGIGPGDVAPVPLPAAGWMLLAGIAGLTMMRRKRAVAAE